MSLSVENLKVKYSVTEPIKGVSFKLHPGEIVGLFGENGAGKTTLMKTMLGLLPIHEGSIELDGEKVKPSNIDRLAFATCEHSFFSELNAYSHLTFYQAQFPKFNEKRFRLLMEFFELPWRQKIGYLSTGQQNQFEVCLALSQGADYIFMDEPFAGNDIFNRDDFYKVLLGILEPHECIILSTHLIEEVRNFIGRVLLLKKGKLIDDISTEEIEEQGENLIEHIKRKYSYENERVLEAIKKSQS